MMMSLTENRQGSELPNQVRSRKFASFVATLAARRIAVEIKA
jgi:hypothetical protein